METINLKEKVHTALSPEEKADIVLSLLARSSNGESVGMDPESILLNDDNKITIATQNDNGKNLCYQAPEIIRVIVDGAADPGNSLEQDWFTLGMLAYFIHTGSDFYQRKSIPVLSLPEYASTRKHVISETDLPGVPYASAISKLTASSPKERKAGVSEFLRYLTSNMPEKAVLHFTYGRNLIATQEKVIHKDITNLAPDGEIIINGSTYKLATQPYKIPYRPGTHEYAVPLISDISLQICKAYITGKESDQETLARIMEVGANDAKVTLSVKMQYPSVKFFLMQIDKANNSANSLGTVTIPKPANTSLKEYKIDVTFDAHQRTLSFDLLSLDNQRLSPMRTFQIP